MTKINEITSSKIVEMTGLAQSIPEKATTTAATKSRPLMNLSTPKLEAKDEEIKSYIEAIYALIGAVLEAAVDKAKSQCLVNTTETDASNAFMKQAIISADKMLAQAKKASHQPWWAKALKVISIVASVAAILVACGTGNVGLGVMGATMLTLQASGANEKMAELMQNMPIWGKILTSIGFAAAITVATCAATAAIGAILAEVGVAASGTAITGWGIASRAAAAATTTNSFGYLTQGMSTMPHGFREKGMLSDEAAQYIGLVTSLAAMFVAGAKDTGGIRGQIAPSRLLRTVEAGLKLVQSTATIGQSIHSTLQANATAAAGDARATFELCLSLLSQVESTQKSNGKAATAVFQAEENMMSKWEEFIEPYRVGAQAV